MPTTPSRSHRPVATLLAALLVAVPMLSACKPGDGPSNANTPNGARSPDQMPSSPSRPRQP